MLARQLITIFITVFSTTNFAEEKQPFDLDDPKPLIMQPGYNIENGYYDDATLDAFKSNEKSGDALTDHCNALLDKAAKLKRQRKPQQHWAAMERYKYECQALFDRPAEKVR